MSIICYGLGTEPSSCFQVRMCLAKVSMQEDSIKLKKTSVRVSTKKTKLKIKVCVDG